MKKTIIITGATDGIGFATAKMLIAMGHTVLIHGRNSLKIQETEQQLSAISNGVRIDSFLADLSSLKEVDKLTETIVAKYQKIDVLINNAGVYVTPQRTNDEKMDVRFVVNTIAPYLLTRKLLPLMDHSSRVLNLSSAAQASVDPKALIGQTLLMDDGMAYAQSKLALTMWSRDMAHALGEKGPAIIAINPKSMLGTEMVKQAYGINGHEIGIGAEILCKAALSEEFAQASGKYFDNDVQRFANPHPDALIPQKCKEIVDAIESVLSKSLK